MLLNRSATNKYVGVDYRTASTEKWFVGLRENLTSDNYIIYNAGTTSDALTINSSTNAVTFIGAITGSNYSGTHSGTSSGTNTGDQTTITGNAGTATTLQTARNIYGNSFNGSADVTGTIANSYLTNSSFYVGTTSITLGRASASQTLSGVSIDGTAGTGTNWGGYYGSVLNWGTNNGTATNGYNRMAARLYSMGRKIYLDETFIYSSNSISVYDNNGSGTLSISRVAAPYAVSSSGYQVQIQHTGSSQTPGYGGFYFGTQTRINATLACVFRAKLPSGYAINWASNPTGSGGTNYWVTDNVGTGKYEDYVYVVRCGDSGTFSSTMFFYITGSPAPTAGSPLTWYLSSATVYDVDDRDNTNTGGYTPVTSNNYNSYAPTLTGGGASGTWGISITGNAATVTSNVNRTDSTAYQVVWCTSGTSPMYSCAAVTIQSSTGTLNATSFSGAGTGLTGTASSLTAGAANSVAWTNVSGRPTAVSSFTNDSGYQTSSGTVNAAYVLNYGSLGTGTMNVGYSQSQVLRNENGLGGNLNYAPVLHLAASDTMWQIQGDYSSSTTLQWRGGYQGTWYSWRTILHSGNYGGYSVFSGNVTVPLNSSSGFASANNAAWFRPTDPSGNTHIYNNNSGGIYLDTNANHYFRNVAGTNRLVIDTSGNATLAGVFTENSSIRYKTNVETIKYGLDKILQMRGVTYERKDNGNIEAGVIAEEMNEVTPLVVLKNKDGEVDSVSYGRINAYLIEAVKELKQEINEQNLIISELKSKLGI